MKIPIVIDIEPHEDGKCGNCGWRTRPLSGNRCGLFSLGLAHEPHTYEWENLLRCGKCQSAESRHKRMVEALRPFAALLQEHNDRNEKKQRRHGSTPIFGINNAMITLADLREADAILREEEGK